MQVRTFRILYSLARKGKVTCWSFPVTRLGGGGGMTRRPNIKVQDHHHHHHRRHHDYHHHHHHCLHDDVDECFRFPSCRARPRRQVASTVNGLPMAVVPCAFDKNVQVEVFFCFVWGKLRSAFPGSSRSGRIHVPRIFPASCCSA